jgi:hypothetical protein
MRTTTPPKLLPAILTSFVLLLLAPTVATAAGEAPVKEVLSSHIGSEVNKNGTNICSVTFKEECQPGKRTTEPGGFEAAEGVAVNDDPTSPQYHDLYVTDFLTHRVQIMNGDGQFVSMFGWEVDETKDKEAGATQEEKNVCTAASHDTCKPGVPGTAAGQFSEPISVTIDPAGGEVYVAESNSSGERVQEFTAEGRFLGEVGNETFHFQYGDASVLAFGGSEGLLYVGEEGRVREFEADGKFKREIPLDSLSPGPGIVYAIAVDPDGDVYLVYGRGENEQRGNIIYELNPAGQAIGEFELSPRRPEENGETGQPNSFVEVTGLALDSAGRLAVTEYEHGDNLPHFSAYRGALYGIAAGHLHLITEFTNPGGTTDSIFFGLHDLAFNDDDELYAPDFYTSPEGAQANELIRYTPVPVAEPLTGTAACTPGAESETDVTLDCALHGEVNPWEVASTEAWFQWGATTTLGQETPKQTICTTSCGKTLIALSAAVIKGLRPNETYYYQTVGEDTNVKTPELLVSEMTSFDTGLVSPRVVGAPGVSFVKSFSAVMSGELNPENANTTFAFQYAPTQACVETERNVGHPVMVSECPGMLETNALQSSEYAKIATTLEARGLQPNSGYRYRLVAKSENNTKTEAREGAGPEGEFQTAPVPVPVASSGVASAVGATSAVISGTVNPDGQPAVYTFELGVYDTAGPQYGIVVSAPAGSGSGPVEETLPLTGLQPGTTYAYRIVVSSSYGASYGETMTFTTAGLPAVLVEPTVLPQIPVPAIAFPTETPLGATTTTKSIPRKCAKGKKLNHGKCVSGKSKKKAKKAKKSSTKERQ